MKLQKTQRIWAGGLALALVLAVSVTLPGLFGTTNAGAAATPQVELDCDTALAGIQSSCNIPVPASGTRSVAVILSNFTGATVGLGAFNFDIFNPTCGGTGATTTPQGTTAATGCTIAAGASGSWPASNPNLVGASTGFTNLVNAAGFATGCGTGGDFGNSATGATNTSTSFLGCFNGPGGETLADLASVILGTETYNVDMPAAGSIALVLSNVAAADDNAVGLVSCDPTSAPPVDPGGANTVSGLCAGATLDFTVPPTATLTNTPLPATATNTPLPATATNTPLPPTATNTPTATPTPCVNANQTPVACPTNTPASSGGGASKSHTPTRTATPAATLTPAPAGSATRAASSATPVGGRLGQGAGPRIGLPDTGAGGASETRGYTLAVLVLLLTAGGLASAAAYRQRKR